MSKRVTRRTFLTQAAAGLSAPYIFPRMGWGASRNGKLQHASIGVGGMGKSDLMAIRHAKDAEIVAICDIDAKRLAAAAEILPDARQYTDWRELLAAEGEKIDSVNVTTPDHMHAPIAISAMKRGKHVYCQKPLAHSVYEVRQMQQAAREAGVVTQMGTQIHSHESYQTAKLALRKGAIGKVIEWHSWVGAPGWPQGREGRPDPDPVPDHVAWDLWLGVAPERPFANGVYHPFKWRGWKDFGSGALGDFGCHLFDPIFMGIAPGPVLSVHADVEKVYDQTWPNSETIHFTMQGSEYTAHDTVKATWYDGGRKPDAALARMPKGHKLPGGGSIIIGEEGVMVLPHWDMPRLYPVEKYKNYKLPDPGKRKNHYGDWAAACVGKGEATCDFDYAAPLTEAVTLGNVANRFPGETLEWNSTWMLFNNAPHANAYLRFPCREGWEIEGLC